MKGVLFGNIHTYDNLSLILSKKEIGSPEIKRHEVNVEGADGMLDFTEYFGEVKYSNRLLKFEFTVINQDDFMGLFSNVQDRLHGRKMQIILDDDSDYYYNGRISVSSFTNEKNIGYISMECDCEPYKYKNETTSQYVNLCGRNMLNLDDIIFTSLAVWRRTETGCEFNRGTATAGSFAYFKIPVKKGQTYSFSTDYSAQGFSLYVYSDHLYGNIIRRASNGNPAIFTAENDGIYLICMNAASSATEGTFSNIMLEVGGTVGEYEAYSTEQATAEASFLNARKTVVATVYVKGSITLSSGTTSVSMADGTFLLESIPFKEGTTAIEFAGNGVSVVSYREGRL